MSDSIIMQLAVDSSSELPVYRRIIDAVQRAILIGKLKPQQKLPARTALAKSLGVNATTVRYAYDILEKQGIIEAKHGSGTYVLPDAMEKLIAKSQRQFSRIYVVIGSPQLSDRTREDVYLTCDLLRGVELEMGQQQSRFVFVESLNRDCLGNISDDSAVLFKKSKSTDMSLYEELVSRDIPVLGIWANAMEMPIPTVHYDLVQAPKIACQHLVDCGYRRIGFVGCKSATATIPMGMKFFGFTDVLHEAGIDYKASHVLDVDYASGRTYQAVKDLIETGDYPEAFFVDTDVKAMEVMHAVADAGLSVPDDIGIVGYDDLPEAAMLDPALTTVQTPRRGIGRRAAELLLNWSRENRPHNHLALPARLIIRQSTRVRRSVAVRDDASEQQTEHDN